MPLHRDWRWLGILALVGLSGCERPSFDPNAATKDGGEKKGGPVEPSKTVEHYSPTLHDTCSPRRRIAACGLEVDKRWQRHAIAKTPRSIQGDTHVPDPHVPDPDVFITATSSFGVIGGPVAQAHKNALRAWLKHRPWSPPSLVANYCIYEWDGEGEPSEFPEPSWSDCVLSLASPPESRPMTSKPELCMGPRPDTGSVDKSLVHLADSFWPHAKSILGEPASGSASVTIAVVDSAPPTPADPVGRIGEPQLWHGVAMAEIIAGIVGGRQRVSRYLALNGYVSPDDPDLVLYNACGTDIGTVASLLRELAAVHDNERLDHTIVNLSLGWDEFAELERDSGWSRLGEASPDDRAGILAATHPVVLALAQLRCRGALVFAAAGNHTPGSCGQTQPVLPAGWQSLHVNAGICQALQPRFPSTLDSTDVPLVVGVRATDECGDLLLDAREHEAMLDMFGHLAVLVDPLAGGKYRGPYSGSSVATAVASGQAAVLWSNHPEWTADGVLDTLQKQRNEELAQLRERMSCAARQLPAPSPDPIPRLVQWVESREQTCPRHDLWVYPQPPNSPCKSCGVKKPTMGTSSMVTMQLAAEYAPQTVQTVELTVADANNNKVTRRYDPQERSVWEGWHTSPITFEDTLIADPQRAYVTMYFTDDAGTSYTAGNEIAVY